MDSILTAGSRVRGVTARARSGKSREFRGDYFFSTMPIKELVSKLQAKVPPAVRDISDGLQYRDFITVGLLVKKLAVKDPREPGLVKDNWIYIQEPDVTRRPPADLQQLEPVPGARPADRLDRRGVLLLRDRRMWKMADADFAALAVTELERIGIIRSEDVLDSTVIRMPKTYPAYFGAYERFDVVREYLDGFENLFLVGRNGMHKYNNQDHSMLTAMTAVDNILAGITDKSNIWAVNTEQDYHEAKAEVNRRAGAPSA